MKLYKKVLILAIALLFVASMGAASVSAQTSEHVVTPTGQVADSGIFSTLPLGVTATSDSSVTNSVPVVGATYKTPTTFIHIAKSQSVQKETFCHWEYDPLTHNSRYVCYYGASYSGLLRASTTGLGGQTYYKYEKEDTGPWKMSGPYKTLTGGYVGWEIWTTYPTTRQTYFVFLGTATYASAKSNVITVKCEYTKTKPYQTTLFAYAKKQVVAHGTTATMGAKLMSGWTNLTGKYVYVWKWGGGKWNIVSRIITRTGTQAGWALADYRLNNPGTGLYQFTFFGSSPYDRSTSNAVQLIWT
jgi:hypothetical protein